MFARFDRIGANLGQIAANMGRNVDHNSPEFVQIGPNSANLAKLGQIRLIAAEIWPTSENLGPVLCDACQLEIALAQVRHNLARIWIHVGQILNKLGRPDVPRIWTEGPHWA